MSKLQGEILTLPKMSGSVSTPKSLSGNVGAKTVNIGGKGDDGATFIPFVSADGIISWTNNQDLPNPEPVNIKGAKGDKGDRGTNGKDGADGKDGKDGYTPIKGVDYFDGNDGASGVHFGSDTPPDTANVWVDPNGDSSGTENWTFTLEDGTTVTKTVVVV